MCTQTVSIIVRPLHRLERRHLIDVLKIDDLSTSGSAPLLIRGDRDGMVVKVTPLDATVVVVFVLVIHGIIPKDVSSAWTTVVNFY